MALALIAAFLLSGIAAASAPAAEFAAQPSFPVKFTGSGGPGFLETKEGRVVTCTKTTATGEVASSTEVKNLDVTFEGCFAERLPLLRCGTKSPATGEILTNIETKLIKGTPVNPDAAKTQVGVLLEPQSTELFAEFSCVLGPVNETLKVKGSIIGKVPDAELNEFRETLHLEFRQTNGTPEPNQVQETGTKHVLLTQGTGTEPFEYEESGIQELLTGSTTVTAEEGKKVKVVP